MSCVQDSQAYTKQVCRGNMQPTKVKFELCVGVKTKFSFQNYMHVEMWRNRSSKALET